MSMAETVRASVERRMPEGDQVVCVPTSEWGDGFEPQQMSRADAIAEAVNLLLEWYGNDDELPADWDGVFPYEAVRNRGTGGAASGSPGGQASYSDRATRCGNL